MMVNIYMDINIKENLIKMENWNMKVNFYLIENGTENDMMNMEI